MILHIVNRIFFSYLQKKKKNRLNKYFQPQKFIILRTFDI